MGRTLTIAQRPGSEAPTHYTWSFPGSPVHVRLALDVVDRLQEQLHSADGAPGKQGLLLGKAHGQTTGIDDLQPLVDESLSIGEAAASLPSPPAGYYRIHGDTAFRLNDSDIALAQTFFPDPHQVFLLIQATDSGPGTATFFFWDEGKMCGDLPFLEFPLDSSLLAIAEQQRIQAMETKSLAERKRVSAATSVDSQAARSNSTAKLKVLCGSLFVALLVSLSPAAVGVRRFLPEKFLARKILFSPLSPPAPAPSRQLPLGLQAERQNGDLKLTWNRESDTVRGATSGLLSIEEGGNDRKIILDPAQVRNGSILYAPTTDQVQAQLTILGQDMASESVIVILPHSGNPRVQAVARREVSFPPPPPTETDVAVPHLPTKPFIAPPAHHATAPPPVALTTDASPALSLRPETATSILPALEQPTAPSAPSFPKPEVPAPKTTATFEPRPPSDIPLPPPQSTPPSALPVYYPPVVAASAAPVYPLELRNLALAVKTVEVRVHLDEMGRMASAEVLPPKTWTPQAMIQASLDAVRRWRFKPARRGNQSVPSDMILQFSFKSSQ